MYTENGSEIEGSKEDKEVPEQLKLKEGMMKNKGIKWVKYFFFQDKEI